MLEDISFLDYEAVVPNYVYERPFTPNTSGHEVIVVSKFREPSRQQVMKYIQRRAQDNLAARYDGQVKVDTRDPIEKILQNLSSQALINLNHDRTVYYKVAYDHIPARILKEDEEPDCYFHFRYGRALKSVMRMRGFLEDSCDFFLATIDKSDEYEDKFCIGIRIENGQLPAKERIDKLLEEGTYGSRTLKISPQYDVGAVKDWLDRLYEGISNQQIRELLTDTSSQSLRVEFACPALKVLQEIQQKGNRKRGKSKNDNLPN